MKILWVKADFLHPTTRGGKIRTLEMLRRLHRRHEVHYVGLADPREPEGVQRASEYSARAWPIPLRVPAHTSPLFMAQLAAGLWSPLPVAISRYRSKAMRLQIESLLAAGKYDSIVCDFLAPAPNIPDLSRCVLFQHNVETMIWRRHAQHAADPLRRVYLELQARRMFELENRVCNTVAHTIAVSPQDAQSMRSLFGVQRLSEIPTGVDIGYFTPPAPSNLDSDLVFVGAMDWLPNVDGVIWFVSEILPLIRRHRPQCSLTITGRSPLPQILELGRKDPRIHVTGTVPDVRQYLWKAAVSIVPLRIGGGTRLKIYESMAARVPVVSTTIGAEGLEIHPPEDIRLADTREDFAQQVLHLLDAPNDRARQAASAWNMVSSQFSWDQVTRRFETILEQTATT
jgi:glycosyltransferase involved in cell wall biosynthesis